jgi:hypothetical protein
MSCRNVSQRPIIHRPQQNPRAKCFGVSVVATVIKKYSNTGKYLNNDNKQNKLHLNWNPDVNMTQSLVEGRAFANRFVGQAPQGTWENVVEPLLRIHPMKDYRRTIKPSTTQRVAN